MITGVVEVGLFCNMARAAYFGNEDGTVSISNDDGSKESLTSVPDVPDMGSLGAAKLQQLKQEEMAYSK
jgi:ribose 5-phosphate isomerase A